MAASNYGLAFKFDISLQSSEFENIILETQNRVNELGGRVLGHGHIADGNLHLNVSSPTGYHPALLRLIEPFVYEFTADARGSVSAEHGVGAMKPNELSYSKPREAIEIMRQHNMSCLPVVKEGRLVGIVTDADFMDVAHDLLKEYLGGP